MAARSALPLLVLALTWACESTTDTAPAGFSRAIVSSAEPVRAWKVVAEGRELGAVVQFDGSQGEGRYYSVRNPWQQELGTIDAQGRAWRFVPHEREARWVATGTLAVGARAILAEAAPVEATLPAELVAPAELVEVPIEALVGGR